MKNFVHPVTPICLNLRLVAYEVLAVGPFLEDRLRRIINLTCSCVELVAWDFELSLGLSVLKLEFAQLLPLLWSRE